MAWGWEPATVEAIATCAAAALAGVAVVFASRAARSQRQTAERLVEIEAARDLPRLVIIPPLTMQGPTLFVALRNDGPAMAGPVRVALFDEQGRQVDAYPGVLQLASGTMHTVNLNRSGGPYVVDTEAIYMQAGPSILPGQPIRLPRGYTVRAWEAGPRSAQVETSYPPGASFKHLGL